MSLNIHSFIHSFSLPDAIGGSLNRTAGRLVKYGDDIICAEQFMKKLKNSGTNVDLVVLEPGVLINTEERMGLSKRSLKAIPNTMSIHQIQMASSGCLRSRKISRTCEYGN